MAVWSIIQFNDLDLGDRFDAEYYQPSFLEVATALKDKGESIEKLAKITCSAFYPAATDLYEIGEVPFIRCGDVISYPVITADQFFEKIPQYFINENKNVKTVKTGDIVITKVGTPCYAGIIDKSLGYAALSRTVLGITNINQEKVNPYYLIAFLRSDFGFYQLMREREQQIQFQLTLDRVGRVNVYLPSLEIQREIGNIVVNYYSELEMAKSLYTEAEELLLHELGLDSLDLSTQKTYIANFSDTIEGDRLDADYLNPKYTNLIRHLRNLPHITLGNLATFSNGATPKGANYLEEGVPFLRIQNINKNCLNLDDVVYISRDIHNSSLKRSQLKPGDVLITITGRIGTAAVIPDDLLIANMNQHSVRLRIKDKQINPYYLSVFLNSKGGLLQSEREAYGATREALPYYCLERLIIPLASQDLQKRIELKIREASQVSQDAKNLLEEAKHRVEKMILGEEHSINE